MPDLQSTEAAAPQPDSEPLLPEARKAYSRTCLNLILRKAGLLNGISTNWVYIIQFAPMYLVAFPIYLLLSRHIEAHRPEPRRMSVGQWLIALLGCEAISIIGNYTGILFNFILSKILGIQTSSDFLQEGVFGESSILFCCIAVFAAPVVEEFLFRKVLIDRVRKYGNGIAVVLSGLLFGLFHGNFTQFFYAAALGMFFALIYVRTGRIRNTILLHMTMNCIGTVIPLFFGKYLNRIEELQSILESGDHAKLIGLLRDMLPLFIYVGFMYIAVIAGIVLLIVFRKQFRVEPAIAPLPKGKRLRTVCLNFGFIAFFLFCVYEFVMQILQNIPQNS